MVALNIKNERAYRLARELADRTNRSLTDAVIEALDERLAALPTDEGMAERLLAIGRSIRARMSDQFLELDHGDYLYDENGLPK